MGRVGRSEFLIATGTLLAASLVSLSGCTTYEIKESPLRHEPLVEKLPLRIVVYVADDPREGEAPLTQNRRPLLLKPLRQSLHALFSEVREVSTRPPLVVNEAEIDLVLAIERGQVIIPRVWDASKVFVTVTFSVELYAPSGQRLDSSEYTKSVSKPEPNPLAAMDNAIRASIATLLVDLPKRPEIAKRVQARTGLGR